MEHEQIRILPWDRVLRAWENSMELVRDFECYAKELSHEDPEVAQVFADFAVEEGLHSSRFREILHHYQEQGLSSTGAAQTESASQ